MSILEEGEAEVRGRKGREGRRRAEAVDRIKGRLWERAERGGGGEGAGVTDFLLFLYFFHFSTACLVAIGEHREGVAAILPTHPALSDSSMSAISFLSKSEEKENQGQFLNSLTASRQTPISSHHPRLPSIEPRS